MHIPDGYISPEIAATMAIISAIFPILSWNKVKTAYTKSLAPLLAVSSAFVFAAQMINFPIVHGTSGH